MITLRRRLLTAGLVIGASGCGPSVPIAPPPPRPIANPVAIQVAPGMGASLQAAGAVYLIVNAIDAKNRPVLPRLSEVVSGELRSATPAEVIVLIDSGFDCPPAADWDDVCRVCHVPIEGAPPSAVVVFCDVLEYDPYTPLRVSLSMRIRRVTDGMDLIALQGTWVGTPPITPRLPPFHWARKKGPLRPNVDFAWNAQFEEQSATELVRHAAYQCVASLQSGGQRPPMAYVPTSVPPQVEELMPPPAPPALPDITPPSAIETTPPAAEPPAVEILPAPEATTPQPPAPMITAPATEATQPSP
jgi:hypothetical protein